jgi:hypothetical protein
MRRRILAVSAIALGLAAPIRVVSPEGKLFDLVPNEACADSSICSPIPNSYCGGSQHKYEVEGL